jgi:AcrR family transcriptional regulator
MTAGRIRQPTFTETARRAQIVQAAIETIAELGYPRASYAQIAKRAGLSSTGLISYHFARKDELIEQVLTDVWTAGQAFMLLRIDAAAGARAKLRAYIESNVEFMATHRPHVAAVMHISNALPRDLDGEPHSYATRHEEGLVQLEGLLRAGQRSGELRRFSTRVMAVTIRGAIDSVGYRLATEPDLEMDAYARELVTLFDHATRSETNRKETS